MPQDPKDNQSSSPAEQSDPAEQIADLPSFEDVGAIEHKDGFAAVTRRSKN